MQMLAGTGLQALGITSPALALSWTSDPEARILREGNLLRLQSSSWVAPVAGLLTSRPDLTNSSTTSVDKIYLHLLPQVQSRLRELASASDKDSISIPSYFQYAIDPSETVTDRICQAGDVLGFKKAMRIVGVQDELDPGTVASAFTILLGAWPVLAAGPHKPDSAPDVSAPQLMALASLQGPGSIGNQPTVRTSEPAAATSYLTSLSNTDSFGWQVSADDFAKRVTELSANPSRIDQGNLNLCGPASFLRLWLEKDPLAAATFIRSLWENKRGTIGSLEIKPDGDFVKQDYNTLLISNKIVIPSADWLVMGAMRGSENLFFDFEGTASETLSAMTFPNEIASWLRAAAVYKDIMDETNIWFTKSLEHALALKVDVDHAAILLINKELVDPGNSNILMRLVPDHYIVLNRIEKIETRAASGRYSAEHKVWLDYWSWGENQPPVEPDIATFEKYYYGAIICSGK